MNSLIGKNIQFLFICTTIHANSEPDPVSYFRVGHTQIGWGFPSGPVVKNLPATQEMQETQVRSPGGEDLLEEEMAIHTGILAWRSPRTEEPGGLQSVGSQRVRHD